jgi:hypothetical protein
MDQDELYERLLTEMHSIIVQVLVLLVEYELVDVLRETITMGLNQEPMLMYLIQENINDTDNMFFNL